MEERPLTLIVAGLAVIGALVVLRDVLERIDRLYFTTTTADELDGLPLTTDDEGEAHD